MFERSTAVFFGLVGFAVGALIILIASDSERTAASKPDRPVTVGKSNKRWDVPYFRSNIPMAIWTDPDTGCQYLILPDGDPAGLRHGVPCPNPEWVARQTVERTEKETP